MGNKKICYNSNLGENMPYCTLCRKEDAKYLWKKGQDILNLCHLCVKKIQGGILEDLYATQSSFE